MAQNAEDTIVQILKFLAMLVVMLVALYIIDAHWLWSIVAVGVFAVICIARIIYESAKPDAPDDQEPKM